MKTKCDYCYRWIKKQLHAQKISPKIVNPRHLAGNTEEEEEEEKITVANRLVGKPKIPPLNPDPGHSDPHNNQPKHKQNPDLDREAPKIHQLLTTTRKVPVTTSTLVLVPIYFPYEYHLSQRFISSKAIATRFSSETTAKSRQSATCS